MASIQDQAGAFADRLVTSAAETMDVLSVYLGDRLGLYRALSDQGPLTSAGLASSAGIHERYAREWLEQQAATGILVVDDVSLAPGERSFSIPEAHALALIDPESPYSVAPLCRSMAACAGALPALLEAYRTGDGVGWEAYGVDMIEAQGDFNRPWLVGSLGTEYLPSIPDLDARLRAGARVADVACGVGWAAISIARAYPDAVVDGLDLDEVSIEIARRNAEEAGLADRVSFEHRDAADPALRDTYDLAIVVEAIHDMSDPVGVLRAIHEMLAPGGTLVVADERVEESFTAPASLNERMFYGYSVLTCLPSGMLDKPSAGTGTVMRASTFEAYAAGAGFESVAVLPIEHDALRFYRLDV